MSFSLWPPELISGLMYSGPGAGPMLAAATAWDELAADLHATATAYQSVITNLTTGGWQGPSSTTMATAAEPYVGWLHTTAGQVEQVGAQAKMAAGAYEAAFAATVPPPVIAANRALLASLVATNLLGQNTPAIAATEMHYLEMWAQDALTMDTYAVTSHQTAGLPQHTPPPPVATHAPMEQLVTTSVQSGVTKATTDSAAALPGLSGILSHIPIVGSLLSGTSGSPFAGLLGATGLPSIFGGGTSSVLPLQAAYYGAMMSTLPARMLMGMGNMANMSGMTGGNGTLMNSIGEFIDGKMQLVVGNVSNQLKSWGSSITAQLASAHKLGGLAVPQAWQSAAPAMTRAAPVLPSTSVSAPALSPPSAGMPGGPFGQALMGALSGRGLNTMAAKVPKVVPRSPAGG